MEAKDLGLAIKDVVLGLGGAAAGMVGGPAAAEGVAKAGGALDRLIGIAPADEKPSRAERFDRADFGARTAPASAAVPRAQSVPAALPAEPAEQSEDEPGDSHIAGEHLRSIGWPADKVDGFLSGPGKSRRDDRSRDASKEPLRTYEVYGVRNGVPVPLMNVLERKSGQWHVMPGAQVRATDRSTVGMGLAGVPGRWREYYPNQGPEGYGLLAGKAVLYWEPTKGRALAASAGLLTQLFGRNWRNTVYRTEEEHG